MEQWCRWNQWLRSNMSITTATMRVALGFGIPGVWRGKSHYSPVKAALLQKLLGADWYERMYDDPKSLWLTPATFKTWQQNVKVRQTVADNLHFWLGLPKLLKTLSAIGWGLLLQAAYDFDLIDTFRLLWRTCLELQWTPDELAYLYTIY
jgi:hypothetical protein